MPDRYRCVGTGQRKYFKEMNRLDQIYAKMVDYEAGNAHRIQHFLKVHAFAAYIGRSSGLSPKVQETLEAAALVHDIGIKPADQRYGSHAGKYQEELGIEPAREMLTSCGYDRDIVERVAYLVGHHHTYTDIDGLDYQILVEADFLVNLHEDKSDAEKIRSVYERIFKTEAGKSLCKTMFNF